MMARINSVCIIAIAVIMGLYIYYNETKSNKIVFVDNIQLFEKFKMKSELEKKYKSIEEARKYILDSLYNEYKILSQLNKTENEGNLELLKREILVKKDNYEKENSETMSQYNMQIWNQLNEYTKQFGEEHGYEYIIGANGQGGLMYAKDRNNVTDALIEFVNSKYSGK